MKVATWNVNSLRVRLDQVLAWLVAQAPDVLAMQETKCRDEQFPIDAFAEIGYRVAFSGEASYNGVAIASREQPMGVATDLDSFDDSQRRVLAATLRDIRVINLYVPNGQRVDSDKYAYKLRWLDALREHLAVELERHGRLVVLGDFNIAPEDRDVHDPAAWAGKIMCSEAERAALAGICGLGLHDTFRLFEQQPQSFTWWDYRAGAFRRNLGLRIDLILASAELRPSCAACAIDTEPRRHERPSDHVPVVAEFASR